MIEKPKLSVIAKTAAAPPPEPLDLRAAAPEHERGASREPEQLAPHSIYSEEAVLGSLLIQPTALPEIAAFLHVEDFFIYKHGLVFAAMLALDGRGDNIDDLTLIEELRQRNQLEGIGGESFITHLLNSTPTHAHAETYGHMVERMAIRRRLLSAASTIAQAATNGDLDTHEAIALAERALGSATHMANDNAGESYAGVLKRIYSQMEDRAAHPDQPIGLMTGFKALDTLLAVGLERDTLTILGARPGSGKTALALNIASYATGTLRKRAAVFSLEMNNERLANRLLAMETGISSTLLKMGRLTIEQWQLVNEALGRSGTKSLRMYDRCAMSVGQIISQCRRLRREDGLDLVVIDHLGLMQADRPDHNRNNEVGAMSRALKSATLELNVPFLVLSQLSRQNEQRADKRPQLSDLRDSGALEQDADNVIFIHRPDESPGRAEIILAKQRDGAVGSISLGYDAQRTRFYNLQQ